MVSIGNMSAQSVSMIGPDSSMASPSGKKHTHQRESRHVHVLGLPDGFEEDRVNTHFSTFGRVQKVERVSEGFIVSFMDVRSAQKANVADHRLESGQPFRISFHDHSKNGVMTSSCVPGGSVVGSPRPNSEQNICKSNSPQRGNTKEHRTAPTARFSASASNSKRSSRLEDHHRRPEQSFSKSSPLESGSSVAQGLQGIYVERLPTRSDSTLKEVLKDALKKHGRVFEVIFETDGDFKKALVLFHRVLDMDKLLSEIHLNILNTRVRIRQANHVAVTEAYNNYLTQNTATASGIVTSCESSQIDLPAKYAQHNGRDKNEVDVFHPKASRTLYVGGLESRISDETLRRRFKQFGSILDVDVKNYESPSPFAFIQFADIDSAVRAINYHAHQPCANKKGKKFQPNFGRSMTTNKLWVGGIPASASEEYVNQKLKALSDGVSDVIFDVKVRQALVICQNTDHAQQALQRIRYGSPKLFVFKDDSGGEVRVPADYCSDRLHDFFVDRKHQSSAASLGSSQTCSLTVSEGHGGSPVLAPPPDPPTHLHLDMSGHSREYYRSDSRRSDSKSSRRRERSRDRSRGQAKHRHRNSAHRSQNSYRSSRRSPRRTSASSSSSSSDSRSGSSRSSSSDSRESPRREHRRERLKKEKDVKNKANGNNKKNTPSQKGSTPTPMREKVKMSVKREGTESPIMKTFDRVLPTPEDRKSGDSGFYDESVKVEEISHSGDTVLMSNIGTHPPIVPSTSQGHHPVKDERKMFSSSFTRSSTLHHTSGSSTRSREGSDQLHGFSYAPGHSGHSHPTQLNRNNPGQSVKRSSHEDSRLQDDVLSHTFRWWPGNPDMKKLDRDKITKRIPIPLESAVNLADPRLIAGYPNKHNAELELRPPAFAIFHYAVQPFADERKRSTSGQAGPQTPPVDSRKSSIGGRTPAQSHSRHQSVSEDHDCLSRRTSGAFTPPLPIDWNEHPVDKDSPYRGLSSDDQLSPCNAPPQPPSSLDFICSSPPSETRPEAALKERLDALAHSLSNVDSHLKQTKEESRPITSAGSISSKQCSVDKSSFEAELERLRNLNQKTQLGTLNLKINPEKVKKVTSRSDSSSSLLSGAVHNVEPMVSSKHSLSISITPVGGASMGIHTPSSVTIASPSTSRRPSTSTPTTSRAAGASMKITQSTPVTVTSNQSVPFPPNFSIPPPPLAPIQLSPPREPILIAPPQPPTMPTPTRRDSTSSVHSTPITPVIRQLSPDRAPTTTPMTMTPKTHRTEQGARERDIVRTPKAPAPISRDVGKLSSRHESFSGIRSSSTPQYSTPMQRSFSMSEPKPKPTIRDPSTEMLDKLLNNKTGFSNEIKKLPRIEKKPPPPGIEPPTPSRDKEKDREHRHKERKHKDHKTKLKEDGSVETKEERTRRKEKEKLKKEKEERRVKKEKKEKHVEKEKHKFTHVEMERKSSKDKKRAKKEKDRKEKKKTESEDSSEDSDSDAQSFKGEVVVGGSMYDRVKRRSSGLNKDNSDKKRTLELLREKTKNKKQQAKRRVQLSSSEEGESDGDAEEQSTDKRGDDSERSSSEEESSTKAVKKHKPEKVKSKKHGWSSSESEKDSEDDFSGHIKKKGKSRKDKKASKIDLEDVFGSSDVGQQEENDVKGGEKKEKKKEKRKKMHKHDSSDQSDQEVSAKKSKKTLENLFGTDNKKEKKKEKKEKERSREGRKRPIEREEVKVAKRKRHAESSDEDQKMTPPTMRERTVSVRSNEEMEVLDEVEKTLRKREMSSCSDISMPLPPPVHIGACSSVAESSHSTQDTSMISDSVGEHTNDIKDELSSIQTVNVESGKCTRDLLKLVEKESGTTKNLDISETKEPETTNVNHTDKKSKESSKEPEQKKEFHVEPKVIPKEICKDHHEKPMHDMVKQVCPESTPVLEPSKELVIVETTKSDDKPKLLTKGAMKVFVPSKSNVATSMVPSVSSKTSTVLTGIGPKPISPTSSPVVNEEQSSDSDEDLFMSGRVRKAVSSSSSCESAESEIDQEIVEQPQLVDVTRQYRLEESHPNPEPFVAQAQPVPEVPVVSPSVDPTQEDCVAPSVCAKEIPTPLPDIESESAVHGLVVEEQHDEETNNAVQSIAIFDDEDDPEPQYPSDDFLHQLQVEITPTTDRDHIAEEEAQRAADALELMDTDRQNSSSDDDEEQLQRAMRAASPSASEEMITESEKVAIKEPVREQEKSEAQKAAEAIAALDDDCGTSVDTTIATSQFVNSTPQNTPVITSISNMPLLFEKPVTQVPPAPQVQQTPSARIQSTESHKLPVHQGQQCLVFPQVTVQPSPEHNTVPNQQPLDLQRHPVQHLPVHNPYSQPLQSCTSNQSQSAAVVSQKPVPTPSISKHLPVQTLKLESLPLAREYISNSALQQQQQQQCSSPQQKESKQQAPTLIQPPHIEIPVSQPESEVTQSFASPRKSGRVPSPSVSQQSQAVYNPYANVGKESSTSPFFSVPSGTSVIQQQQAQQQLQQTTTQKTMASPQPRVTPTSSAQLPVASMGGLTHGTPLQQHQQLYLYQQQMQKVAAEASAKAMTPQATPSPAPTPSPAVSTAAAAHLQQQQLQQQHHLASLQMLQQLQQNPALMAQLQQNPQLQHQLLTQMQLQMFNPQIAFMLQQQQAAAVAAAMQRQTSSPASTSSRLQSPHPAITPSASQQQQFMKQQQQENLYRAQVAQAQAQQAQREREVREQQAREQAQREREAREQAQKEQAQREQQAREVALREQQVREAALREKQARDQQAAKDAKELQAREQQRLFHAAAAQQQQQQQQQQRIQQAYLHQLQQQQKIAAAMAQAVATSQAHQPQIAASSGLHPVQPTTVAEKKSAAVQPLPRISEQQNQQQEVASGSRPAVQVAPQQQLKQDTTTEIKQPLQEATNQERPKAERYPVIWQGQLAMKNQEANVQMHMVAGSSDLVLKCLGNTKENGQAKHAVRINQRMRLEASQLQGVVSKMTNPSSFACMICLPCGETRDQIYSNNQTFQSAFIDYFAQKQAAGIANIPETELTQSCLVHIFPPGEFPAHYLQYFSQELFASIKASNAGYLFVVLTPEEKPAV